MGVGEFLSSKATNEWILSERKREEWEMENYPEGEIQEMIDIYKEKGMEHEDAKLVIETMAKYKDFFVDLMMAQELELQVCFRAIRRWKSLQIANESAFVFVRFQTRITWKKVCEKVLSCSCRLQHLVPCHCWDM